MLDVLGSLGRGDGVVPVDKVASAPDLGAVVGAGQRVWLASGDGAGRSAAMLVVLDVLAWLLRCFAPC